MRGGRALRRAGKLLAVVVLSLVFVVAIAVGALFHLDIEPVRRIAVARLNTALETSFRGSVELTGVSRLRAGVLEDAQLRVRDPRGREVLRLDGVDGNYDVWKLLRSFFRTGEPIEVTIRDLEIAGGHVVIEQGPTGELTLSEAFAARDPTTPQGRGTRVQIDNLTIHRLWVHGGVEALPVIDVELTDVLASLDSTPDQFAIGVERMGLLARRVQRDVALRGHLQGELSLQPGAPESLAARASFAGRAGDVRAEIRGSFAKQRLDAEIDLPTTAAEHLRALVPELPLYAPVMLHARAQGTLENLAAEAEAAIGDSRITMDADARLGAAPELSLKLVARRLDARAFSPDAPATSLDLNGALRGRLLGGRRPYAEFSLETKSAVIEGTRIPALSAEGRFRDQRLIAHARAHEPGAPAVVDLVFTPASNVRPGLLDVEARVQAELAKVTRLPERIRGRADVNVSGQVELPRGPGKPAVHARVSGRATRLAHDAASAAAVSFSGTVDGPLATPEITLRAEGRGVRAGGRRLDRLVLAADGPVDALRVDASLRGPDLPRTRARAVVSFAGGVSARAVTAELERGGVAANARARRVAIREGVVTVDALRVSGIGNLSGNARIGSRTLQIDANADALRLGDLARLAGLTTVQGGTASLEVALRSDGRGLHGRATGSLRDLEAGELTDGNADADLSFQGRTVRGSLDGTLGKALTVRAVSAGLRLPRGRFSLRSLTKLEGELRVHSRADLRALVRLLPDTALPFGSARGKLELDATIDRDDARDRLSAKLEIVTRGLALTGRGTGRQILTRQQALRSAPWELSGVDAVLRAELANGGESSHARLRLVDRKGSLAELDAELELRFSELLKRPGRAVRHALDAPLSAKLVVPERSIDDFPRLVRPRGLTGRVGLTAQLSGKLTDPQVELDARGKGLQPRARRDAQSFDANARLRFADSRGHAEVAIARRGVDVLRADSTFELDARELVHGRDPRMRASAALRARGFELESIPWLKDHQLAGRLDGALDLEGLGRDAKLAGDLRVTEMRIGRTPISELRWSVHAAGPRARSELLLRHTDGYAHASIDAGLTWGPRIVPALDETTPFVARLRARNARAGVLLPLVDEKVAKLDGRLDANLRAVLGRGRPRLAGTAIVREGVVQLPAIGQELRSIRGRIELRPDGTVLIRDVSARGLVGRVKATAALRIEGLRLASARANVQIAEAEKMPLTVEGVSLGEAWGSLEIEARSPSPQRTRIDVDVRSFHLDLPERARQQVQSLEEPERIRVGVRQQNGRFVTLPLQPLEDKEASGKEPAELLLVVKLGNDVWLRQGTMLRIKLDGAVAVRVLDEPRVRGQLQLTRGRIDVQGKIFEITSGTVTFQDDPANPVIAATARWESPDGITVFADFTGPVKSGTLELRSEPAYSQDEILALLLFGTPDGSFGAGQAGDGGKAATAVALGGGVASKGLNAGLGRLTNMDVTTRIDSSGQSPRPELAVQVSRRVTAELAYNLGEPAPGKPPDRTFFTLDFRLGKRWSLATTFGDRGSSLLDLLWRYRY